MNAVLDCHKICLFRTFLFQSVIVTIELHSVSMTIFSFWVPGRMTFYSLARCRIIKLKENREAEVIISIALIDTINACDQRQNE